MTFTAAIPCAGKHQRCWVHLLRDLHARKEAHTGAAGVVAWAQAVRVVHVFQFVLIAGLSAANNLAERSIRPLVVIRKISGGSRNAEGTKTRMALASLFET